MWTVQEERSVGGDQKVRPAWPQASLVSGNAGHNALEDASGSHPPRSRLLSHALDLLATSLQALCVQRPHQARPLLPREPSTPLPWGWSKAANTCSLFFGSSS